MRKKESTLLNPLRKKSEKKCWNFYFKLTGNLQNDMHFQSLFHSSELSVYEKEYLVNVCCICPHHLRSETTSKIKVLGKVKETLFR
jgi:hypothetical protein